ncbi:MAG: hypothetical protein HWN68_10445 [Desulfobacterales bacterium]|nr:hypothetical protein [Desulfobacterales bacterium]
MSKKRFLSCAAYGCLFSLFWLFPGSFAGHAFADEGSLSLSGLVQLRYDGRYLSGGNGEDHKLHQIADLNIKENKWGHFRFSLAGDMIEDIDSQVDDKGDRTRTIHDTWDSSYHGYLYVCQAELYELGHLNYARFGRQYVNHELTTTHLDGFNCLFNTNVFGRRIQPFVYGGIPVRLYDGGGYRDAQELGGGAHVRLDRFTKITLEHQFIEEEPDIVGTYATTEKSSCRQSAFAIRRDFLRKGYGYISLFLLDNSATHINMRYSLLVDRLDLDIDASYFYQFRKISEMPTTISPYTGLTGPIKPHHRAALDIMKGIYKDNVWISGGTEWRVLDAGEEETEFNHSYNHEYLALIIDNLPKKGIHFSLQADFYKVMDSNNEDTILNGGAKIGYEKPETINISIGSFYSLYSYDYYSDTGEKTDVRTVNADIRYYIKPGLYFDARYELDIYDIYEHRFIATLGLEL